MGHIWADKGYSNNRPAPCKDCKDRKEGCHSVCKPYKEWSAEVTEKRQKIRAAKKNDIDYRNYFSGVMRRANREK